MDDDLVSRTCARFGITPRTLGLVVYRFAQATPRTKPVDPGAYDVWLDTFLASDIGTQKELILEAQEWMTRRGHNVG